MALKVTPLGSLETTNPEENPGLLPLMFAGAGVPTADLPVGSLYLRSDGGAATTLYVKEAAGSTWAVGGGGGGLSQGTADTLYTALAPATAARNTVTPAAGIQALTITAPASGASPGIGIGWKNPGDTYQWRVTGQSQTFSGQRDDMLQIGWNATGLGTQVVAGENALSLGFESHYFPNPGRLMEMNLDYISADGLTGKRFFGFNVDRSSNLGAFAYIADEVYPNGGLRIEEAPNDYAFGFYPVGTKRCAFRYASNVDLQIGYDGGTDAPTSMSIGPSAQIDYNGVFMKLVSGSTRVSIGTNSPDGSSRLTVSGGWITVGVGAVNTEYFNVGSSHTTTDLLTVQNTSVLQRTGNTGLSICKSAFWQEVGIYANNVKVLAVGPLALTIVEAGNIVLGTTTGTKIGTAANQKLGFWGVTTPVVQPTGIANAVVAHAFNVVFADSEIEAACDALGVKINAVITALESIGILATV